jgi:hypothetical protein
MLNEGLQRDDWLGPRHGNGIAQLPGDEDSCRSLISLLFIVFGVRKGNLVHVSIPNDVLLKCGA